MEKEKILIKGEWKDSETGKIKDINSPETNETLRKSTAMF